MSLDSNCTASSKLTRFWNLKVLALFLTELLTVNIIVMKMLVNVAFPIEPFNSMVKNGTAGEIIGRVLDDVKPEAIYFTELDGNRAAVMVVDVPNASAVPIIAEPWYLNFEAECEFRIAMTPNDLMQADLGNLGKKWS